MNESKGNLLVALDTNLIVSGTIARTGRPNQILRAWQHGEFTLVTSEDLLTEATDVLTRDRIPIRYELDSSEISQLLKDLRSGIMEPMPLAQLPLRCRDPKDDAVLACALAAEADYIVTGDNDLLVLDGEPALGELRIVTPRRFLEILGYKE